MIALYWALGFLALVAVFDILNRKHTIRHNFPIIGRFRYWLEKIGPELRQYIVANNTEERPFSRDQRSWIYASAKQENNLSGFGTDKSFTDIGHVFVRHSMFPYITKNSDSNFSIPCAKIIGPHRQRPYHPKSIVNISGMSFGALSAKAVESMSRGAKLANCYHNTGEGGLTPYHLHGGDVIFQIGTGYFGVRNEDGSFSMSKLKDLIASYPTIKAIEIKLSQGAKPGKGGILPAVKVTKEIAEARGVHQGQAAISPSFHSTFDNIHSLIGWIEQIATETGLPVGIKTAIGNLKDLQDLAVAMFSLGEGPDFITIDGGEGGTGAAPQSFADHVSLPFDLAFTSVYKVFKDYNLTNKIVFIGSGKLGFPVSALKAFALGIDVINCAREVMMSIGCIQAQTCHTNRCPSGVATQNKWLQNGIDSELKSQRCANYIINLRKEILDITHACGYQHPCQMKMTDIETNVTGNNLPVTLKEMYKYDKVEPIFNLDNNA